MIEVQELRKTFGQGASAKEAVRGVSFSCEKGAIFGLLGPNGAGKSTTLRMLASLITPDSGEARINGFDVRTQGPQVRESIGFLSTNTGLYGRLTAREAIHYFGQLQGIENPGRRTDELLEKLEIAEFANDACEGLSTGMKQKVSIARAIVHDPPIYIFDEPTNGLDVMVAQVVLNFVEQARDEGRCVLLSTHIMSEAERLCERIAIIHGGRILANDTLEGLRTLTGEHYLESIFIRCVESSESSDASEA